MSKYQKFIALYDCHFGWEKAHVRGKWLTRPTYAQGAINATLKFAKDFQPEVVVLGGDQLEAGPVSHWHQGRPILDEGFRLKDELELCEEKLLSPLEDLGVKRKIWHIGNHEEWINHHVQNTPALEGLIEPENQLMLYDRKWEIYSVGEISRLGKLHFVHGDVIFRNGSTQNPAKKLVLAYRRNIRAGHLHTYSAATEVTAVDATDYHTGIVVPALSTKNHAYSHSAPNNCMQGFLYGYVNSSTGEFSDFVVIINEDKFNIGGTTYKA